MGSPARFPAEEDWREMLKQAAPDLHERHRLAGPDREGALRGGGAARQQENS